MNMLNQAILVTKYDENDWFELISQEDSYDGRDCFSGNL